MTRISATEIAALCARHFGVSPRALTLDCEVGVPWRHVDDATALFVYLARKHTSAAWVRLGQLLGRPGREGERPAVRVWQDTHWRLQRDDLLVFAMADIEVEIEAIDEARALEEVREAIAA